VTSLVEHLASAMIALVPRSDVPGWTFGRVVLDGEAVIVGDVNPWDFDWKDLGGSFDGPHPSYPTQRHVLSIWPDFRSS
jgi:hypothetical protein